jgi:hypothetical protein
MPHIQFEKIPRGDLCSRIKPYVTEIKKSANDGNVRAQEIISLYRLHVNCPTDPGAAGLCGAAFDEWLRQMKKAA